MLYSFVVNVENTKLRLRKRRLGFRIICSRISSFDCFLREVCVRYLHRSGGAVLMRVFLIELNLGNQVIYGSEDDRMSVCGPQLLN